MSKSSTTNESLLSNKTPSGTREFHTPKLGFGIPPQKSTSEFAVMETNGLIRVNIDEMTVSYSSAGSIPTASLSFKYSLNDPNYEAFSRDRHMTQDIGLDADPLGSTTPKESTNPAPAYNTAVERDLNPPKAKDPSRNSYASMSHVLVQFGRTYAVCYVPHKNRGTFGLNELVLCEAAHGEATGTSVADLTPYIDEVRTQQAPVLKSFPGDPLCPEGNAGGAVHYPLYQKIITSGLHCDDYLARLPRILRRGVNKDKKRVHFSHRRNGEALRVLQQLLRERQWDSFLNVAEVAYQGDFLSTTLHLHGHPDAFPWKPLEYRRAGESFTAVLRTNIVEFRHSYACPEQLHLTRNIIGHTLDNLFTKFLLPNEMKKGNASRRCPPHDNLLLPTQRPHSLPSVLQTAATTIPGASPSQTPGLSVSQMSYSPGTSSVGMQALPSTPCYPPPKYSMCTKASCQQSFTLPGSLVIPSPGEGRELCTVVPIPSSVSPLPSSLDTGYIVSMPAVCADVPKAQPLYYMVAPQAVPYCTSFVMPQSQVPMTNTGVMAASASAAYVTPPQIVGYTPPLDGYHGLMPPYPPRHPISVQQGWNLATSVNQQVATSIPFASKANASSTNSNQAKRAAWECPK